MVTPKGAQTPAEAVAEMVMDKLSEVKNDARVRHTTSTVTVVNSQFAGDTGTQAVTEAKINRVRLLSFINEGDSVKVKMAFRVKTVLSDAAPSGGTKVQKTQLEEDRQKVEKERNERAMAKGLIDNGNGTVTDNATKLMWQQGEGGFMKWEHAITYCKSLSLAKYNDWRLPKLRELESIIAFGQNPTINKTYFPNGHSRYYWSSTTNASWALYTWGVDFDGGNTNSDEQKTHSNYVRCVRGGQ